MNFDENIFEEKWTRAVRLYKNGELETDPKIMRKCIALFDKVIHKSQICTIHHWKAKVLKFYMS